MNWKDCGYISLTKDEKKVTAMVKKVRYIASLDELKAVVNGEKDYTLILEPKKE
jgi:hypothetical protein